MPNPYIDNQAECSDNGSSEIMENDSANSFVKRDSETPSESESSSKSSCECDSETDTPKILPQQLVMSAANVEDECYDDKRVILRRLPNRALIGKIAGTTVTKECTIPLHPDDYLEVKLYNENNAGIFIKGLSSMINSTMSKDEILIARKKLLRQHHPPTLRLLPGMKYNKKMNLVTKLNNRPLELHQRVLNEPRKSSQAKQTNFTQKVEHKIVNNTHYPNLPATSSRRFKTKIRTEAENITKAAFRHQRNEKKEQQRQNPSKSKRDSPEMPCDFPPKRLFCQSPVPGPSRCVGPFTSTPNLKKGICSRKSKGISRSPLSPVTKGEKHLDGKRQRTYDYWSEESLSPITNSVSPIKNWKKDIVGRTLKDIDEEKKSNFECEKRRKSAVKILNFDVNKERERHVEKVSNAQSKSDNVDSDLQILFEDRVAPAVKERDFASSDSDDESLHNNNTNEDVKGDENSVKEKLDDRSLEVEDLENEVPQSDSVEVQLGNLSYIFRGDFFSDSSNDILPATPKKINDTREVEKRSQIASVANEAEVVVRDRADSQRDISQAPITDSTNEAETAYNGMNEWFINMVETTEGLDKNMILENLKSAERDEHGRIRPSSPQQPSLNRPLSPVMPVGGNCTEPIYSSMRFMQIPLYETLTSTPKSYPVANEEEMTNQKNFFMKRTPTAIVGNKRLFLGKFDGRVQLHIFQESGSHPWQCISLNMIELQKFLAQGPDILMDGVRTIIDDSVTAKLKPIDMKMKEYIEKRDCVLAIRDTPEMCQQQKFEICELTIAHLDKLIQKQTIAMHHAHNWGKNARMQVDLNQKVVSLFENRLANQMVTVRRMTE